MDYALHGATLALAWFLAINAVSSAGVAMFGNRARRASPLFALRVLPATLSTAFVLLVFVPSYWRYEPRNVEGFDFSLTSLAVVALGVIAAAVLRSAAAWRRADRRARDWTRTAVPLSMPGLALPAFRIEAPQPVMALVGIVSPRVLVTSGLIDVLTAEELAAALAHEIGHYRGWDNLKRLAMHGAPDLLSWTTTARVLERRWAGASEHKADALASAGGSNVRLALASALVKIARLTVPPAPLGEPISALVGGGAIVARVERLIDDRAERSRSAEPYGWGALACGTLTCLIANYAPLLQAVHHLTEFLVHRLP